jgi:hypothetical protein
MLEIGAIEKKILDRWGIVLEPWRCLVEPVIFDALDNFVVMVTESNQLFECIPLDNPQRKPTTFIIITIPSVVKSVRTNTVKASKPLDIGMRFPVANTMC